MDPRKQIQEELTELGSSLGQQPDFQPYAVPDGYFENFPEWMLSRVKQVSTDNFDDELLSLSPLLAGLSKQMPFEVPQGNFESLQPVVEDSEISKDWSKVMPYAVPESYFEGLPDILLARVSKPQSKVVPLYRRGWMKMAVAAMVAGIMVFGGIRFFNTPKAISVDNPQWVASKLKNVPDKALDEFVNTAAIMPVTAKANTPKSDNNNLLKDVSDKELEAFLDQIPEDEEIGIN